MKDIFTGSNHTAYSINENQWHRGGAAGQLPTIPITLRGEAAGRSLIFVLGVEYSLELRTLGCMAGVELLEHHRSLYKVSEVGDGVDDNL